MIRSLVRSACLLVPCFMLLAQVRAEAATPDCAPNFRVGNVIQVGSNGCEYTYMVDAICTAGGACSVDTNCFPSGPTSWAWNAVKTGGSGSIAVDRTDWMQIKVTVTPPVKFTLQCTVGGCSACCVVPLTRVCTTTPVTAPTKVSSLKSIYIKSCN